MAGVHAPQKNIGQIVEIIEMAIAARQSVEVNLFFAVFAMLLGVGIASSWHVPQMAVFIAGLVFLAGVFSTVNGPYVLLGLFRAKIGRVGNRLLTVLGVKRRP